MIKNKPSGQHDNFGKPPTIDKRLTIIGINFNEF
jgi:hypothetical protein